MKLKPLFLALALTLTASTANAWFWFGPVKGNDTGGIIAWSPEIDQTYGDIAAAHCARYNKVAFITSVHRIYGDFVAFVCAFPRGYDPRKGQY